MNGWIGFELFYSRSIKFPDIVAAYNIFMNDVDSMDQMRATSPTSRAEQRLNMSIFTLILDLTMENSFSTYSKLRTLENSLPKVEFHEFKRRVVVSLVQPLCGSASDSARRKRYLPAPEEQVPAQVQDVNTAREWQAPFHVLLDTKNSAKIRCFLWPQLGMKERVMTACSACGQGFHENCFAAYL